MASNDVCVDNIVPGQFFFDELSENWKLILSVEQRVSKGDKYIFIRYICNIEEEIYVGDHCIPHSWIFVWPNVLEPVLQPEAVSNE
jgi:hypothetical protein